MVSSAGAGVSSAAGAARAQGRGGTTAADLLRTATVVFCRARNVCSVAVRLHVHKQNAAVLCCCQLLQPRPLSEVMLRNS